MRDPDEYRCFIQLLFEDLFELARDANGSVDRHCGGNVPKGLEESLHHHYVLLKSKLENHKILILTDELLKSMDGLVKTNEAYMQDKNWELVRVKARIGLNSLLNIDLL